MYKNLNPVALGVSGRQSELIELALTYGFRSIDIDLERYLRKAETKGPEQAGRFLTSAKIKIGGFELPINWRGPEDEFKQELEKLDTYAQLLAANGASIALATVQPFSDDSPYHENFELHRQRLAEIAQRLGNHEIRLGVGFLAAQAHREGKAYQFICDAEAILTLVKSIAAPNVGLNLDTWNWYVGGGSVDQLKELEPGKVISVSIADVPTDVDASQLTEDHRRLPSEEGAVKNQEILQGLVEQGFDGPLTLVTAAERFKGMVREAIVQKCASILDELVKASDGSAPKPVLAEAE